MRKFQSLLLIALVTFLFSCDNNNKEKAVHTWNEAERSTYLKTCTESAAALGDRAKPYCECSLVKLEVKYPEAKNVGNLTTAETEEIAKECLK